MCTLHKLYCINSNLWLWKIFRCLFLCVFHNSWGNAIGVWIHSKWAKRTVCVLVRNVSINHYYVKRTCAFGRLIVHPLLFTFRSCIVVVFFVSLKGRGVVWNGRGCSFYYYCCLCSFVLFCPCGLSGQNQNLTVLLYCKQRRNENVARCSDFFATFKCIYCTRVHLVCLIWVHLNWKISNNLYSFRSAPHNLYAYKMALISYIIP